MPKCKYCGGTDFYEGPSGGMSTNVLCANAKCRHWFNHTPALDLFEDLNRVEPTDEEKLTEAAARQAKRDADETKIYDEGAAMYRAGKIARACLYDPPYGGGANLHNLLRLAGFVDAMEMGRSGGKR
jgi:hypothetical protein